MAKISKTPVRQVKPAKEVTNELSTVATTQLAQIDQTNINQALKEEKVTLDEEKKEGIRKLQLQNDILQAELDKIKRDNTSRGKMGNIIAIIVSAWLALVMVIMFLVGFREIELTDKVLITLLATTSLNVIGLLVIVSNYLFNKSKST